MEQNAQLKKIIDKIVEVHKGIDTSFKNGNYELADKLRMHMAPLLTSFEYHMSSQKELKDCLDVSIGVSNSLLLLANALAIDFGTINFEGRKDETGNVIKSDFRENFEKTNTSGSKLIADNHGLGILIEVDNPEVWKKFNAAIAERVDAAFSMEDDFVNKQLRDETVDLNQAYDNPLAGIDGFVQEIVNNILKHIPEEKTNHLDQHILTDLIKDLAKASVAAMLMQSLSIPEVDKDGNLVVNGEILSDTTQVNVARMQMATYMGYGVNERHTQAKRNLETWLKTEKRVKVENLEFPWIDGKGVDGLNDMIGEVSKNFFIGLCKANWALADHFDPVRLEKVCPTKTEPDQQTRWEEYIDQYKNLGTRPLGEDRMPIDEPKVMRKFRDQKVFYERNVFKAKAIEYPIPFKAFQKVYKTAIKIVDAQFYAVKPSKYIKVLGEVLDKKKQKLNKEDAEMVKLRKLKENINKTQNIEDKEGEKGE